MASKTADSEPKNCIELGHIVGLMVITDLTFMKHSAVMWERERGRGPVPECCLTTLADTWVACLDNSWRQSRPPVSPLMSLTLWHSDTLTLWHSDTLTLCWLTGKLCPTRNCFSAGQERWLGDSELKSWAALLVLTRSKKLYKNTNVYFSNTLVPYLPAGNN